MKYSDYCIMYYVCNINEIYLGINFIPKEILWLILRIFQKNLRNALIHKILKFLGQNSEIPMTKCIHFQYLNYLKFFGNQKFPKEYASPIRFKCYICKMLIWIFSKVQVVHALLFLDQNIYLFPGSDLTQPRETVRKNLQHYCIK